MVSLGELANFIADPDEGDIRLHQSAFNGDALFLKELLSNEENLKNINFKSRPFGATPLRLAATIGDYECAKLLLENGANVNATDFKAQTPLFLAIKNNHIPCAELLLQYGANPNGDERNRATPLYLASQFGLLDSLKLLLRNGAATENYNRLINCVPGLPLHISVVYQNLSCFYQLLLGGAKPNLNDIIPPIPEAIISQLSIPHAMVRYRCPNSFAYLYKIFGGNLWQRDVKNKLAIDLEKNATASYVAEIMGEPLSLRDHCRIAIRGSLEQTRLKFVDNLPLPSQLLDFIKYVNTKF